MSRRPARPGNFACLRSSTDSNGPTKQQTQEKRKLFWKRLQIVPGAFFGALFAVLLSNAVGEPWAAVSYRDRHGNLVTEPDWCLAFSVSLILGGVAAGIALWACLTADKHKKT